MAVISKNNSTTRTLTSAACWEPAPDTGVARVPLTTDIARWYSASNAGGTFSGSLTVLGLQVDGATADIGYTSGTLTLTQTDAFVNGTSNNRRFTISSTGVMALGASNRNLTLVHTTGGYCLDFAQAGALTGSGIVSIINGLGNSNYNSAYFGVSFALAGFTGTIRFTDGTGVFSGATATGTFTAGNLLIDGPNCILSVGVAGANIGAAGRTLTINEDVMLGRSVYNMNVPSNVVLAGTGTRTLTVGGNTDINGTVTGSNGVSVNVTDTTLAARLVVGGVSSGLSGPCVVSGNRLAFGQALTADRYAPSSLTINAGAEFHYNRPTQDFNFPTAPTGSGYIVITGSLAGTGCTFPAGLLDSFTGRLVAWPFSTAGVDNLVKMVIHQIAAGGLEWRSNVPTATANTARFTYANAANVDGSFPLLLDTYLNTTPATLLTSEYSLIVPSSSGTFKTSGTVTRQNSIGTTSARMSLTLGGTNTGDNTLSGVISEVGGTATLGITKQDAGRWVLSGTNTYTGVNTISAGTLSAQSAAALGAATSTGGVTISGTGVLELAGDITLNKSITDFTVSNATNPIQSVGDNTLQTKLLTLSVTPTFTVTTGNKLTLTPVGAGKITGAQGIAKAGDGTLSLSAVANDFTGGVVINAGVLEVGSVANANSAAAWGRGDSNPTVVNKGTLRYTGSGGSTTRTIRMDDAAPTLESSGSGALTVETLMQNSFAGTRDLTLGGSNEDDNEVTSSINDNGGTTNLVKAGAGKWVLSGALSYGGTTTVSDGTLRVKTTNSNTNVGAVTIASSATVELVTDTAASSGASAGQVLGAGDVTVNGGTIKTRGGVVQKGSVRYNGNLTFGSGSKLYIGAAA